MLPSGPHDEFLELCAVSTSGQLSEEEQNRLKEHLAVCPACREAIREYESVVNDAIPAIGAEQSSRIDPGPGFSQSKAEKAFFERLAKEEGKQLSADKKNGMPSAFRRVLPHRPRIHLAPCLDAVRRWHPALRYPMSLRLLGWGAARHGCGQVHTAAPGDSGSSCN